MYTMSLRLATVALLAAGAASAPHGTDKAKCHNLDGSVLEAPHTDGEDGHAHHHRERRLDHPGTDTGTYLGRSGACNLRGASLIRNYTASSGNKGGTYVRVFSDGSTTAQIDAVIMRNGAKLKNISVMAFTSAPALIPTTTTTLTLTAKVCARAHQARSGSTRTRPPESQRRCTSSSPLTKTA